MENTSNTPLNNSQDKGTNIKNQLKTIFQFLQEHTATASMVAEATGIPQKCITRYKRDLELANRLWEVKKDHCKQTGQLAYYLTTNPAIAPSNNQLNLFNNE
jgi:hypothetical protein